MAVIEAEPAATPDWHADLWSHMVRAIGDDRVSHGLLVCGPPGVGKRVFARRIVAALLCRDRRPDGDACGQCPACRQYAAGSHPDISTLTPEEPGKLIKVDAVRAFNHRLALTPQYDSGRIGWIDPAEQLSISAANSLLKTLEEPPTGCHLILVSDYVSALMATIRSRCQLWRVPPPEPASAQAWLRQQGVDAQTLDADSLRAPFAVIERAQRGYDELVAGWDADIAALLQGRADASQLAESMAKQPADLWLDWLYRRVTMLLTAALGGTAQPAALASLAPELDTHALQRWCRRATETARLARSNADWQLVIESLLLQLSQCRQRKRGRSR